jgi:hypothetical protein
MKEGLKLKEGLILEFFINNQKKSKKQIADDLAMSRRNLYDLFTSATLKDETKEKFEKYFGIEIFSGENKRSAELAWMEQEKASSNTDVKEQANAPTHILQDEPLYYKAASDYQKKYVTQLEQHNKDLKYTVEVQKKLIERLEFQIKPSNNSEAKEKVGG